MSRFNKEYTAEELQDIERDVLECMEDVLRDVETDEYGFFEGIIEVTVTYIPTKDDSE